MVPPAGNPETVNDNNPYGKLAMLGGGVGILLAAEGVKPEIDPTLGWPHAFASPTAVEIQFEVGAKAPVSETGPFTVTLAGLVDPVKLPLPNPVQPSKP